MAEGGINMDKLKFSLDLAAAANVVATIVGILPYVAAVMSIVWYGLQIYWGLQDRKKNRSSK